MIKPRIAQAAALVEEPVTIMIQARSTGVKAKSLEDDVTIEEMRDIIAATLEAINAQIAATAAQSEKDAADKAAAEAATSPHTVAYFSGDGMAKVFQIANPVALIHEIHVNDADVCFGVAGVDEFDAQHAALINLDQSLVSFEIAPAVGDKNVAVTYTKKTIDAPVTASQEGAANDDNTATAS